MDLVKLSEAIRREAGRPFRYGVTDCFQFTASVVRSAHGLDYAAEFGVYGTRRESLRILRKHGGYRGLISSCLGEPMAEVELGRDGDVALCACDGVEACGVICQGAAIIKLEAGAERIPLGMVTAVWAVGRGRR